MKRLFCLIITLFLCDYAFAYDFCYFYQGQTFYINIVNGNAQVTYRQLNSGQQAVPSYGGNIIIPSEVEYNGIIYSVTSIGAKAFQNSSTVTYVSVPNTISQIGEEAFRNCADLDSITIPNSVTVIENATFCGCVGLSNVNLPNSLTTIGNSAFEACFWLNTITIPNTVTHIGEYAFRQCSRLTSIEIPSSVSHIGKCAFSWCDGLTSITVAAGNTHYDSRSDCNAIICSDDNILIAGCKTTVIPNGITRIEDEAFYGCCGLYSVTIPNSCLSIGARAFQACGELTSIIWGDSVARIEKGAFIYCTGLTSIVLPSSLISIDKLAFGGCENLNSIIIPNSVTKIGAGAFSNCINMSTITIGSSVDSIGDYAFDGCVHLYSIKSFAEYPPLCQEHTFEDVPAYADIIVPCGTKYRYVLADYWKDFVSITEDCSEIDVSDEEGIVKVYTKNGKVVVEDAEDNEITLYDLTGHILAMRRDGWQTLRFDVPSAGVYLVKVGYHTVHKVVVMR